MSKTIEEILAPKPAARPRIYAYSIADAAHAGQLKVVQSQRDCVLQPRVARHELPWVSRFQIINPDGVASSRTPAATPSGLTGFATITQGSSCLATLGFEPESRWDSSNVFPKDIRLRQRVAGPLKTGDKS